MIRRFCSGILDAGEPAQEPLPGIDHDEPHPEVLGERLAKQLRLLLAHQPVVDVDAGQAVPDRPMDERRGDRRVDAARQRADDEPVRAGGGGVVVDAATDLGDGLVDEARGRPGLLGAGDPDDEVAEDVPAARRVDDLGVELDAVEVAVDVDEAGERRRVGLGGRAEAGREAGDRVAVAHPDRLVLVEAGEEPVVGRDRDRRGPVLALRRRQDVAAELVGHELRAVADAEDGDVAAPDRRDRARGASASYTEFGPPERMIAFGARRWISDHGVSCGSSSE